MQASQDEWRACRRFLNEHRPALSAAAAGLYPLAARVEGTLLLAHDGWLAPEPVDLQDVRLHWDAEAPRAATTGREPESAGVRPLRGGGQRFATYADAVAALDRPRLFENRPAYRLLDVDLAAARRLSFGDGEYFDVMNVSEAVAHEYAQRQRTRAPAGREDLPLRAVIGDPFDLGRRPLMVAMCALTLRHDPATGAAAFVLHWRDPARVATGGGLHQVMPVGVFQATGGSPADRANDFDLWRGLVREYSEEFLGAGERTGEAGGVLRYEAWPFFRAMSQARSGGRLRVHCFGVGVDPLTLAADILLAVVFDRDAFDELLGGIVASNEEGRVVTAGDGLGIPFSQEAIEGFLRDRPMQPAGAAVLAVAWRHRRRLLSR
ncbi:MAG TPA: transcriptional regulator [Candidatus Eisenbacteria bacterium]|nr:transcriptional regulator [Candidatus Eisenbacteria bacterium]